MADKRISQLTDRGTVANSDVVPIVVSGASTTNKATISSIQTFMQGNLDLGVTSVGLSMPSAFTVTGSPVTSSGNISVVGAGTVSQYIRGDGSLADFPQGGGGGGASVSYYLNLSVSQGSIGGIAYSQMNRVPVFGAGTDVGRASNGYIASFITDAGDPALLEIPAGNWNFETYLQASSGGGSPTFYIELYKVNSGGTATLIASNSGTPEAISLGTNINPYFSSIAVPTTSLTLTDRLAIRIYVTPAGRTITLHTENSHLCQIITTFTTGLTALNGLTAQVQNFATGSSGTDFGISSSTSTHTFNLPTASATNRGALSSADWTTFNNKQAAGNYVTTDTNQSITGFKSFTNGFSLAAIGGGNQATTIKNIGTIHEGSAGVNQIGFNNSNNIYFGKGLSNGGVLQWTNSAVRYYTLPDADGTLALTSNLNSYLPLTGGTLTGTLNGTNANFSGSVGIGTNTPEGSGLTVASGGILVSLDPGANRKVLELYATSTGAKVSSSYVGASSYGSLELLTSGLARLTIADTGGVTLTGALNGTSGTFSGGVVSNGGAIGYGGGELGFGVTTASATSAIYTLATGSPIIFFDHRATGNTGSFVFRNGSGGANTLLTLASNGAATFSSSVTATSAILGNTSNNTNAIQFLDAASSKGHIGSGFGATFINNNSFFNGSAYVFDDNTKPNSQITLTAGTVVLSTGAANVDPTAKLTVLNNGNVGIGTASPDAGLTIETTSTSFNALALRDARAYNASPEAALAFRVKFNSANAFATPALLVAYKDNATDGNQAGGLQFYTNGNSGPTERMRITSGGDVVAFGAFRAYNTFFGISNSTGSTPYGFFGRRGSATGSGNDMAIFAESGLGIYTYTNGGVSPAGPFVASGGTSWTNGSSDIRKKKNFETTQGLAEILQIEPIKYHFNEDEDDSKKRLGFKAQNLLDIIPEMVSETGELAEDGTSYLTITPDYILPILVKAIQEQQVQINQLKNQIQ